MSLTKFNKNINYHQSEPDQPTKTADEMKRLFDQAGIDIKEYLNTVLTAEIDRIMEEIENKATEKATTEKYGNCKIVNTLETEEFEEGVGLSAYQGKILNDKIDTHNITTADTDLNNYTEAGTYYFSQNVAPLNIPAGVNGILEVIKGETCIKQKWYRHGTNNVNDFETYIRMYQSNGDWSDWQRFITKKEFAFLSTSTSTAGSTYITSWSYPTDFNSSNTHIISIMNYKGSVARRDTSAAVVLGASSIDLENYDRDYNYKIIIMRVDAEDFAS